MAKSEEEVRTAIERCLAECCRDRAPVVKLAECVEGLRAGGWESADVRRVESLVLKVLAALWLPKGDANQPEQSDRTDSI